MLALFKSVELSIGCCEAGRGIRWDSGGAGCMGKQLPARIAIAVKGAERMSDCSLVAGLSPSPLL